MRREPGGHNVICCPRNANDARTRNWNRTKAERALLTKSELTGESVEGLPALKRLVKRLFVAGLNEMVPKALKVTWPSGSCPWPSMIFTDPSRYGPIRSVCVKRACDEKYWHVSETYPNF